MSLGYMQLLLLLGVVALITPSLADLHPKYPPFKKPPVHEPPTKPGHKWPPGHKPPTPIFEHPETEEPTFVEHKPDTLDKPPHHRPPHHKPPPVEHEHKPPHLPPKIVRPPPTHKPSPPYGHHPGHPPAENTGNLHN